MFKLNFKQKHLPFNNKDDQGITSHGDQHLIHRAKEKARKTQGLACPTRLMEFIGCLLQQQGTAEYHLKKLWFEIITE